MKWNGILIFELELKISNVSGDDHESIYLFQRVQRYILLHDSFTEENSSD